MFGILNLNWWQYVITMLVLTQLTAASITIFLHRHQAHKALELHPIIAHCFRFWLWLSTGMITKMFVAIHRKHHAKCETEEDPHSPKVYGLWRVLFDGMGLYRIAGKDKTTLDQYGMGTPNDWIENNLYTKHSSLGRYLLLFLYLILFGVPGLFMWIIQMLWTPIFAAGVINGIGHFLGYRNFNTKDFSHNISPIGIFIGGEELHNNHHAYPASAKLSVKWWEFDMGWFYISLLKCLGLAKVNRTHK